MIIIGTPKATELDQYYMADGDMIWQLTQAGFVAKYMIDEIQFFKINKKLIKKLNELGIKI